VPFDPRAAQSYSEIVIRARRAGYAIALADAQIAAIGASRHFSVATRDETPFRAASVEILNPWEIIPPA
jgi:hypothetical protein